MKTAEELHAHQSKLPPLRSYFVIWERPHGSYTWTLMKARAMDREEAELTARMRVDDKTMKTADCVVTEVKLPRMPSPEDSEPIAVLPDGHGHEIAYYGKGHAR